MGMFGDIAKITQTMNLPGVIKTSLGGILQSNDQRRQFMAVLMATAAHIESKPNFNYELEMNELWIRLGNLRGQSSGPGAFSGMSQAMGRMTDVMKTNGTILGKLSETMQAVANTLGR